MDCIFCKIISGEIPSSKVYEDENFLAFLDINPSNFGHTLVVPKQHFENVFDMPDDIAKMTYPLIGRIASAAKKAVDADGLNVVQNNGESAGQIVFHSHIHLIPRFTDDGFRFSMPHKEYESTDAMIEMAERIAKNIR